MILKSLLLLPLLAPSTAIETEDASSRGLQNGSGVKARVSRLETAVDGIYNILDDLKEFQYDGDAGLIERLSHLVAQYKNLQEGYDCLQSSGFHVNEYGDLIQDFQCHGTYYSNNLGHVVGPPGDCNCHDHNPDDHEDDESSDDIGEITVLPSCRAYYNAGFNYDGFYAIDPDGPNNGVEPFKVWCDQTTTIEGSDGVAVTGGWTLFAYHKGGQNPKRNIRDTAYPDEFSVSANDHWVAIRSTMEYGMIFIDEFNQTSAISKTILETETNCHRPSDNPSLVGGRNRVLLWIEDDCDGDGDNYCGITLNSHRATGAALFDQCGVGIFDAWPYGADASFEAQKELKYFVG